MPFEDPYTEMNAFVRSSHGSMGTGPGGGRFNPSGHGRGSDRSPGISSGSTGMEPFSEQYVRPASNIVGVANSGLGVITTGRGHNMVATVRDSMVSYDDLEVGVYNSVSGGLDIAPGGPNVAPRGPSTMPAVLGSSAMDDEAKKNEISWCSYRVENEMKKVYEPHHTTSHGIALHHMT